MSLFENFSALFVEVWKKGILGIDIFQILIGLGIFLIFLLFRGFISKIIINRLKKIAKKTTNKLDDTFVQAMEGPARFFPIVIGFFIASYYLEFSPESQSFIDNVNKSLITILIFWLIHQFIQPVSYLLGGLEKLLTKDKKMHNRRNISCYGGTSLFNKSRIKLIQRLGMLNNRYDKPY